MTITEPGTTLRGLSTVRVRKSDIIDIIRKNRDEHRRIFEEALEGWKQEATKELEEAAKNARLGIIRVRFNLPQPKDHTKDYDRVIAMLEISQDDELELSVREFSQFVRDEWGWQTEFLTSSSMYSRAAQNKLETMDVYTGE